MKRGFRIVLLAVAMASVFWFVGAEEEPVAPPAPYFGLKAPGMVPEVFAPGIVSTGQFEFGIAFSRDGTGVLLHPARHVRGRGQPDLADANER